MRWLPPSMAALVLILVIATKPLGPISRAIAIACVIASFAATAIFKRKDVRAHGSVVAGIAAVTAAGQVEGGALYAAGAAAFLLASLYTLRVARRQDARVPITNRARRSIVIILGITGTLVALAVAILPPLAARIERAVVGALGSDFEQTTAFSTTMYLGATTGMLQSDALVARIDGPRPDYLRGAVYDRYDDGRWISIQGRHLAPYPAHAGATSTMTLDRSTPEGADMRWFLPPGACNLDRDVDADSFGVVRRKPGPLRISYATSGCTPPPILPPTDVDLEVDSHIRKVFAPIATQWTAGAKTDREKLQALLRELSRYEYSLAVERSPNVDPVVDFLTIHKSGHCEFFASAMVLLARTQGIPSRLIGGYHLSEVNPITHQTIVRDRNAHSWVETWQDGAWHAWDPTPITDGPGMGRSFLDHVGDLWALTVERLRTLSPLGIAAVLVGVIAVLLVIRSLTIWARQPRRRRTQQTMERPLPCFETLTRALETAGFTRDESEPIEAFAERIPNKDAASALIAYAAFRYGGIGDELAITKLVQSAAATTAKP